MDFSVANITALSELLRDGQEDLDESDDEMKVKISCTLITTNLIP